MAFGARRRPEDATEVRLPEWEGPLGLLLALVEARRLDVLSVPLGDLAEAYLDALATLDDDRLGSISAFVAVASQLILFKSRAMLPRPPASGATSSTTAPTRRRSCVPASCCTGPSAMPVRRSRRARSTGRSSSGASRAWRRRPAAPRAVAPDAPRLDVALLVAALDRLAAVTPAPAPPPEVVPRTITLAERARAIRAALASAGPVVLQDLLAGVRDRVVAAVTFLALLELVKRREVTVEQDRPWGPILVRSVAACGSAAPAGASTPPGRWRE